MLGTQLKTEMVLPNRVVTERYQIGRLLGSGGFGAVYLAEDLRLQRQVAIKICSTRCLPPEEAGEAARLFQQEALTLARLHHPGLTAVWDYFNEGDEWFLVMEYVPGETLRDLLKHAGGSLPSAQAIDYAGQLCDVLRYLHAQPEAVVFRDLKPGNIIVTPLGQLKLIDFGIARLFSPGKSADTSQFGTPGYAPPEQYGGQTEPRSDIYSLGVVTHQMLTGHNPAASPFAMPPARAINPALSPHIEAALLRATAHQPADRFATVDQFCEALRLATGPTMTGPTLVIKQPPAPEPISRPLWTPAPRFLPEPPRQAGASRGLGLLLLLVVALGSMAAGGWLARDEIISALESVIPRVTSSTASGAGLRGTLAYVAPGPQGGQDLYLRRGASVQRLTNLADGESVSMPALAPDGSQIAYGVSAGNSETLWISDLDGTHPRRLLEQYPVARAPSWSRDGRRLLVEVAQKQEDAFGQHDIVEVAVGTGEVNTVVETPAWEGGPSWSPIDGRIVFHARSAGSPCMLIYLLEPESGAVEEVTSPPSSQECTATTGDFWPSWSPDGKQIAFGRKFGGSTCDSGECVAVLDLESRELEVWRTGPEPVRYPRWSPDGDSLIFNEGPPDDSKRLARLDLGSRRVESIDVAGVASRPDWR